MRVLVVDDDLQLLNALKRMLGARGIEIHTAEDDAEALAVVRRSPVDLVLTDVVLGHGVSGLDLLPALREVRPTLEAIVMSGHDRVSQDDALRAGALEFIRKDFSNQGLFLQLLDQALHRSHAEALHRGHALPPPARPLEETLVGASASMARLRVQLAQIAGRDMTVLVLGETGTGKELIARALHEHSRRRALPFVSVNCGAIPEGTIASELFGHVRGSFTGAVTDRAGYFREAHGGTIFLDEIGELPPSAQAMLLRTLQQREVTPVGADAPVAVDVRLVAATHRDLKAMVREGTFRADLYFRVNVFSVSAPPLRDRPEDLDALVAHLIARLAARHGLSVPSIDGDAIARLRAHPWPGNVRELENALERALILAEETGRVASWMLPEELQGELATDGPRARFAEALLGETYAAARERVLEEFLRFYCEGKVRRADNNVSRAASESGIDRANFRRLLRRLRG
jgi:two-component system response regulator HydG